MHYLFILLWTVPIILMALDRIFHLSLHHIQAATKFSLFPMLLTLAIFTRPRSIGRLNMFSRVCAACLVALKELEFMDEVI